MACVGHDRMLTLGGEVVDVVSAQPPSGTADTADWEIARTAMMEINIIQPLIFLWVKLR